MCSVDALAFQPEKHDYCYSVSVCCAPRVITNITNDITELSCCWKVMRQRRQQSIFISNGFWNKWIHTWTHGSLRTAWLNAHSNHRDLDGSGTMLQARVLTAQLDNFQNNICLGSCRETLHASVTCRVTHEVQSSQIHGSTAISAWRAKSTKVQRNSYFLSQACGHWKHK